MARVTVDSGIRTAWAIVRRPVPDNTGRRPGRQVPLPLVVVRQQPVC
jgi:hypothetical protein